MVDFPVAGLGACAVGGERPSLPRFGRDATRSAKTAATARCCAASWRGADRAAEPRSGRCPPGCRRSPRGSPAAQAR